MQTWNAFWLRISDLFHSGHHEKSCSLTLLNYVVHTLELIVFTFHNVWVHIVGGIHVGVKPVRMVYGKFSAIPALQRGIGPTCWLSYNLFSHTHTRGRGLPFGIIWVSWSGKARLFLIRPVRIIYIMNSPIEARNTIGACYPPRSSWFASVDANVYYLRAHAIIKLFSSCWKLFPKRSICIEGFPPNTTMNVLGLRLLYAGCTAVFIVLILFSASTSLPCFWPKVSSGFSDDCLSWNYWGNLDLFWY